MEITIYLIIIHITKDKILIIFCWMINSNDIIVIISGILFLVLQGTTQSIYHAYNFLFSRQEY